MWEGWERHGKEENAEGHVCAERVSKEEGGSKVKSGWW